MDELLNERFKLIRILGEGGQGRAHLAEDLQTGGQVVIKELIMGQAADWKAIELFERENTILKNLNHPAIPAYIDGFHLDDGARVFLVQEFIAGENLEDIVAGGELFDDEMMRDFLGQMLDVLRYLHAFSPPVIHRDIKPSNILRDTAGKYHLVDFGAVQLIVQDNVGGSTIVGTSGFMPPEQLIGRATPASDLYSLAATCVQLASGMEPGDLPMTRMKLAFRDVVGLDSFLLDVLDRMLEPAPDQRFFNAIAVQTALQTGVISPAASSNPGVITRAGESSPGAVSLRRMLANPPQWAASDEIELLNDGTLRVLLGTERRVPTMLFTLLALSGFGLSMLAFVPEFGGTCCYGPPLLLISVGALFVSNVRSLWHDVDLMEISSEKITIVRGTRRKVGAPVAPKQRVELPLRHVRNCYLYVYDKDQVAARLSQSQPVVSGVHKYSGIYFFNEDGREHRMDLGALFKRDGAQGGGMDDAKAQANWLFEVVQAQLKAVTRDASSAPAGREVVLDAAGHQSTPLTNEDDGLEHAEDGWATVEHNRDDAGW